METKLVCDIMSTLACFIKENVTEEETKKHLTELFQSSPLQKVAIGMAYEHMQILKSKVRED